LVRFEVGLAQVGFGGADAFGEAMQQHDERRELPGIGVVESKIAWL
jgi:hypothetical protein